MFNHHDIIRDSCMLHGPLAHHGYDWWWHSFTAQDAETGEDKCLQSRTGRGGACLGTTSGEPGCWKEAFLPYGKSWHLG